MSKEWNVQFTALGTVSRDNVNDTMIMLESTGINGLMAYLLLILAALKQIPTKNQRWMLLMTSFPIPFKIDLSSYHTHAITYILATSLMSWFSLTTRPYRPGISSPWLSGYAWH